MENVIFNSTTKEGCTCYNCNHTYDKEDIKIYNISERVPYSKFPWLNTDIVLCEDCQQLVEEEWFDNDITIRTEENGDIYYDHEDELENLVLGFTLEYQEKVYNQGYDEDIRINKYEWIEEQQKLQNIVKRNEEKELLEKEQNELYEKALKEYYSNDNFETENTL